MLIKELLTEDRISFVADQLGDKLLQAYLNDHGQMSPGITPLDVVIELSKVSPKLVHWLATRYVRGEFKFEDLFIIKAALERFVQVRAQLPPEHKDLNKLSLGDLYRALAPYEDKEVVSNKQAARDKKQKFMDDGDAELIYKDKTLVVLSPKTKEASCYFGIGTKWCTSATKFKNAFNTYNKRGPLYIIMTKSDGKFQVHFQKNEFMNATNERLSGEEMKALITKYPKLRDALDKPATAAKYLPLIKNPDAKTIRSSVTRNPGFIIFVKNPTENLHLAMVKRYGQSLVFIKNPSEKVQLAAVSNYAFAIEDIENPTEEMQLAAVNLNGVALVRIKNPSEKVQLAAVTQNGIALNHIKNPSEKVQLAAVTQNGSVIDMIKNPSEPVQIAAVKDQVELLFRIANPTEKVQLLAIKQKPDLLRFIDNPTEKVQLLAIKLKPDLLIFLDNPTDKVKMLALKQDGMAIKHIKNPTEQEQLAAISQDGYAITHIKNPSERVRRMATIK